MNIPSSIVTQVKENALPTDNAYFHHAESAMNSLKKVNADTYCYDYVSIAANTLERIYKGFLLNDTPFWVGRSSIIFCTLSNQYHYILFL